MSPVQGFPDPEGGRGKGAKENSLAREALPVLLDDDIVVIQTSEK
jgi:hypothetical protein